MSWPLIVRSTAERDLVEAFQYYESVVPGLGTRFVQRVDEAVATIALADDAAERVTPSRRYPQSGSLRFKLSEG